MTRLELKQSRAWAKVYSLGHTLEKHRTRSEARTKVLLSNIIRAVNYARSIDGEITTLKKGTK